MFAKCLRKIIYQYSNISIYVSGQLGHAIKREKKGCQRLKCAIKIYTLLLLNNIFSVGSLRSSSWIKVYLVDLKRFHRKDSSITIVLFKHSMFCTWPSIARAIYFNWYFMSQWIIFHVQARKHARLLCY